MGALQKLFENHTIDELAEKLAKDYVRQSLGVRLAMLYYQMQNILIHSKSLKEGTKLDYRRLPLPEIHCNMLLKENPELDEDYLKEISYLIPRISYKKLRDGDRFEKEIAEGDNIRIVEILKIKIYNLFKKELKKGIVLNSTCEEITEVIKLLINSQTENDLP